MIPYFFDAKALKNNRIVLYARLPKQELKYNDNRFVSEIKNLELRKINNATYIKKSDNFKVLIRKEE